MIAHVTREPDANVSVDELLTVAPYFSQHRSMTEAATELAIPFARTQAAVEQIVDIDQPGLLGVWTFEVDYHNSFDVRIRPQATVLSQPCVLIAEETTTLLLVLEIIEGSTTTTPSEAARTTATKFRSMLGASAPIINPTAAENGKPFSFSEQIHPVLHQHRVLRVRYQSVSGQATIRELDCINVYTVESTTYLRAVNHAQEDSRQKSLRANRLGVVGTLDIPAGFHRTELVDIRDPHTFGAETGTSEWASVLIDTDTTWITDYEPISFTENEGGQENAEGVFNQDLRPSEFSADVPMSDLTVTISFALRRPPSITVTESLKLKNVVVA